MINIENMSDKAFIAEQYKDTDKLALRKGLHEKYSVNKIGFQKWMFVQYPFRPKCRVLELGSGRGELWNHYFEDDVLQSYEMDLTLSDFSDGMVDCLRRRFHGRNGSSHGREGFREDGNVHGGNLSVQKIDIMDIPFEKETFDIIIANSMLYHVRDIDSALSQVRRVLKRDGMFYCSTLGVNGMTQYLYSALDELDIPYENASHLSFTLQNGTQLLKKQFHRVERRDYVDALEIDHVEDYVEYIYSMASMQGLDRKHYDRLLKYFNSKKVNGFLHIPKEYGMFVAG